MNKPEIQAAFDKHLRATTNLLLNIRDETGACSLCRTLRGSQHLPSCPAWPLIDSRIEYRMAQDRLPPVMEVLPSDTVHVYRRRA